MLKSFIRNLEPMHRHNLLRLTRGLREGRGRVVVDPSALQGSAPQPHALDITRGPLADAGYRAIFVDQVLRPALQCILAARRHSVDGERLPPSRGANFAKAGLGKMIHRSRLVRIPASALKDLTKLADESARRFERATVVARCSDNACRFLLAVGYDSKQSVFRER